MIQVRPESHDEDQDAIEIATPSTAYLHHTAGVLLLSLVRSVDVPASSYPMEPLTVFGAGRRLGRLVETADKHELVTIADGGGL